MLPHFAPKISAVIAMTYGLTEHRQKRQWKFGAFVLFLFSFSFVMPATAAQEHITNFDARIVVDEAGVAHVHETIAYDFGDEARHGIYRNIPVKYKARGGTYKVRLSDVRVTDENGAPYTFDMSSQGKNVRLRIGDADRLVEGEKTYLISYTATRVINFFDDHDELYWNVNGNEWEVPILRTSIIVELPGESRDESAARATCFKGPVGSQSPCMYFARALGTQHTWQFEQDMLDAGEGLTVIVGIEKGHITPPPLWQKMRWVVADNWILGLPFVTLICLIAFWFKKGRDPKGRGTIITQFDPPDDLTPAQVGTLVDERAQNQDISAEIIHLAVLGYIKITRLPKAGLLGKDDYQFERLKDADTLPWSFQKKLMSALFAQKRDPIKILTGFFSKKNKKEVVREIQSYIKEEFGDSIAGETKDAGVEAPPLKQDVQSLQTQTLLSQRKDVFATKISVIYNQLYRSVVKKGYFTKNPTTTRNNYISLAFFIVFVGVAVAFLIGFLGMISVAVSGVIVAAFGVFMPVKTQKGVLAKEHILGLKEYLMVAEKDRIAFHNAPKKDPQLFERLLPYAMVLKVEKEWAKQFEDIYKGTPPWYDDKTGNALGVIGLTDSLRSFGTQAHGTMTSATRASSGGSGFSGGSSGGGFGGGGGGSW